jgi:hypothetical protein
MALLGFFLLRDTGAGANVNPAWEHKKTAASLSPAPLSCAGSAYRQGKMLEIAQAKRPTVQCALCWHGFDLYNFCGNSPYQIAAWFSTQKKRAQIISCNVTQQLPNETFLTRQVLM